ncbi:hypothetical protein KZZ52_32250 [Dactylosporangium sp. AC04546]|uniref:hypothetical protein n=1 Tax=Dactylosporangium sp. AC04546 TaxID=2862460 RepID=UPI001EDD279F|nr:hypothetical protein [Dactylosporangium sp. AC04546]WVK78663.1 hypothetical protein KZZ52_32250 [Dactylosporangium sp. AC04546]
MTITETVAPVTTRRRVPITVRLAQLLLLVPLGAFQLVASIAFSLTMPMSGRDYAVAAWAVLMSLACVGTALRLGRGGRALRVALALLGAQTAFSLVKLIVFGESASLVFLAVVAAGAGLLALPASRRHFSA